METGFIPVLQSPRRAQQDDSVWSLFQCGSASSLKFLRIKTGLTECSESGEYES